jgi:hypothetical protein
MRDLLARCEPAAPLQFSQHGRELVAPYDAVRPDSGDGSRQGIDCTSNLPRLGAAEFGDLADSRMVF